MQPKLIIEGDEFAVLVAIECGGLWMKGVQAEIGVMCAIVKETDVKKMLRRDVVLQAEQIVSRPNFRRVGAARLLFDDRKSVLEPDRIGKPKTAALDRP